MNVNCASGRLQYCWKKSISITLGYLRISVWVISDLFSTTRRLVRARSHVEDEPSFRFTLLIAFAVPLNIFHVQ